MSEGHANRFTADALQRIRQLRAMADDFPDVEGGPLTSMEIRLARHTAPEALERAAVFAEAVPSVAGGIDVTELREAIAFELAYGGVHDEAVAMARRIERAILRRKLKAVRATRALYRVAKGYVTMDAGDAYRPHVEALGRALVYPKRRKSSAPEPEETE